MGHHALFFNGFLPGIAVNNGKSCNLVLKVIDDENIMVHKLRFVSDGINGIEVYIHIRVVVAVAQEYKAFGRKYQPAVTPAAILVKNGCRFAFGNHLDIE